MSKVIYRFRPVDGEPDTFHCIADGVDTCIVVRRRERGVWLVYGGATRNNIILHQSNGHFARMNAQALHKLTG